jgi:histidine ammonia-lyase
MARPCAPPTRAASWGGRLRRSEVRHRDPCAYKLRTIIDNCEYVLGIELISAAQAAELLAGLHLSGLAQELLTKVREQVDPLDAD